MHEFSIAEGLLDVVIAKAREAGAGQIRRVDMRIGALSGVVAESLEFAFQALSDGTIAAGALLAIQHVPLVCHCGRCGKDFAVEGYSYRCPACQDLSVQIVSGREMEIVSMEIE